MRSETFVNYKNYRWLWANLAFLSLLVAIYIFDAPVTGPRGNTLLGYTYGILAAAGILYLMWYGIRKRSYKSHRTTLKGCLAGHIWLGIALTIIVPLHSGFAFGVNVHTLTYVLMVLVIASGIWGAFNYVTLAPEIESHRGSSGAKKLLEQVQLATNEIEKLSRERSDAFMALLRQIDFVFAPSPYFGTTSIPDPTSPAVTELVSKVPESERADAYKLIGLVTRKRSFVVSLSEETRTLTKVKIWLYLHLPVSCALVACLFVHIFSVLFYR